jgi:hypothetical protein
MKALRYIMDNVLERIFSASPHLEEADATILEFQTLGHVKNGTFQVRLLLQVTPRHGRNYVTECIRNFQEKELSGFRTGNHIKIYYQRNNPMKIHLTGDVQ